MHRLNKGAIGYLQVDDGQTVPVSLADDAVEILESGGQEGPESSLHPDGLSLSEAHVVCAADAPHEAGLRAVQGDQVELREHAQWLYFILQQNEEERRECDGLKVASLVPLDLKYDGGAASRVQEAVVFVEESLRRECPGVPGKCGWNIFRLVDLTGLSNLESGDLWVLGTADPADIVNQVGIWDRGGLGIWDQGLMGIGGPGVLGDGGQAVADAQSPGGRGSQVAFGGCGRRSGCLCGGLESRGRPAGAPQLQPHYPENNVCDMY